MKNFIYILLLCLLFGIAVCEDVASSNTDLSEKTNLFMSRIADTHFLSVSFKNQLYRFSVYALRSDARYIDISIGSIDGTHWTEHREIIGHPGTETMHVNGTFVIDNELYLFFYAGKNYMTKTTDGLDWDLLLQTVRGDFSNPILTSGYPVDLYGNDQRYIFICTRMVQDAHKHKTRKGQCEFSSDKGKTWVMKNIHLLEEYSDAYILKIFYHNGYLHALTSSDKHGKVLFMCHETSASYIECGTEEFKTLKEYEIENISNTFDYLTMVLKLEDSYYRAVSFDGIRVDNIQKITNGERYDIVATTDYSSVLFLDDTDATKVLKNDPLSERKVGCQYTENNKVNKLYSHRFFPTMKKNSCTISYTECEDTEDGEFKTFYILLPFNQSLSEECFMYNYVSGVMFQNTTSKIIKIKQTLKTGPSGKYKEIQFYLPKTHSDLFFNRNVTRCATVNGRFIITFIFNNLKKTTRITSDSNTTDGVIDMETKFESLYNQSSLSIEKHKYEEKNLLNAGDFIYFTSKSREDGPDNFRFPKGTYMIYSRGGVHKFILSNYIPSTFDMEYSQIYRGIKKSTKIGFGNRGIATRYAGFDLTNSSPNYESIPTESFHRNPSRTVVLANFKKPQILGLVCPLSRIQKFTCFDEVYNRNGNLVKIDTIFGRKSVFTAPKINILSENQMNVLESKLYLTQEIIDEMIKMNSVKMFTCKCGLRDTIVKVQFVIAPTFSERQISKSIDEQTLQELL